MAGIPLRSVAKRQRTRHRFRYHTPRAHLACYRGAVVVHFSNLEVVRSAATLRVVGGSGSDCTGATRRSFLQAGVLGVGGLGLADHFRLKASQSRGPETSVILFWMSGGPGHMETWDPKPDAVRQFRGPFGATNATVPGVLFGELLPEHAKVADKLAILRGVNHGSGDHTKGNH
jgi:hypothetical protein